MIIGAEVYHTLKNVIKKKYGQDACNVGDEGGFAPSVQDNNEALDVLMEAINQSGHAAKVKIGTDVAASEFYNKDTKKYDLDFKNPDSPDSITRTGSRSIHSSPLRIHSTRMTGRPTRSFRRMWATPCRLSVTTSWSPTRDESRKHWT